MKFSCFELQESFNDLNQVWANEIDIMDDIHQANQRLVLMESFQGETATDVKNYFDNIHNSLSFGIMAVCAELDVKFRLYLDEYYETIDDKKFSVINTEHINNLISRIGEFKTNFNDMHSQIDGCLSDIADIFQKDDLIDKYEENLLDNLDAVGLEMRKVADDLGGFDYLHKDDCEDILALMDSMEKILDYAEQMFDETTFSYSIGEVATVALSEFQMSMYSMAENIQNHSEWLEGCMDALDNIESSYDLNVLLNYVGISLTDYHELAKRGIKLQIYRNNGNTVMKITSSMSNVEIKNVLNSMNLQHLTNANFNKLTGNGLVIVNALGNIKAPKLVEELGNIKGFFSKIEANVKGEVPTIARWSGRAAKVVNGIGWVLTGVVDVYDNVYDEVSGEWTLNELEPWIDSATDIAIDVVSDIGIDMVATTAGAWVGSAVPVIGTSVSGVVGAGSGIVLNIYLSFAESGEPGKTVYDYAKDAVSDKTHELIKDISQIIW